MMAHLYFRVSFPSHNMAFDSITHGAHLFNVTARVQGDRLRFTGTFDSAELLPVLIFSAGVPWVEPCVRDVCCLWDVAQRYKDEDLMMALGPSCGSANLTARQLMKGSGRTAVGGGVEQWDLTTLNHPNFVAMLFLCITPVFYMYYEVVPVQWVERDSVVWSTSWYGDVCHTVVYPDGREICIHCANAKPPNSLYVFSPEWFQTFECKWVCVTGYTGPGCEMSLDVVIYAVGAVFAVLCVAGVAIVAVYGRGLRRLGNVKLVDEKHVSMVSVPDKETKSEMIAFKEDMMGEIRFKFS